MSLFESQHDCESECAVRDEPRRPAAFRKLYRQSVRPVWLSEGLPGLGGLCFTWRLWRLALNRPAVRRRYLLHRGTGTADTARIHRPCAGRAVPCASAQPGPLSTVALGAIIAPRWDRDIWSLGPSSHESPNESTVSRRRDGWTSSCCRPQNARDNCIYHLQLSRPNQRLHHPYVTRLSGLLA